MDLAGSVTRGNFLELVQDSVPEALDGLDLDDYIVDGLDPDIGDGLREGDLLIHLLLPDLLRFAVATFHAERNDLTSRLLTLIDYAFFYGDHDVWGAIAVSFIEHVGAFESETPEFIATWPQGLRTQNDRINDPNWDQQREPESPTH